MATRFKIGRGTAKNLPSKLIDGFIWFTTDTGELYIDAPINGQLKRTLINPKVNIDDFEDLIHISYDVENQNQVSKKNTLYIFNQINHIPRLKIGDGKTLIKNLMYLDNNLENHVQDTDIHITAAERQKWNKAEPNIPSDWNQNDAAAADFIKNKPQIPSKVSDLQNDVGYLTEHQDISGKADIASVYTKDQIDAKFSSVMNYKGTVMSVSGLPNSGNTLGDVYHVNADGSEWAWNGKTWEELGKTIDISGKVDKVAGKDLSTNDFTDADKTNLDANTAARHTHENKSVLDTITAENIEDWNNGGVAQIIYTLEDDGETLFVKSLTELPDLEEVAF